MNNIRQQLAKWQIILSKYPSYKKYNVFIIPFVAGLVSLLILIFVTIPQIYRLVEYNKEIDRLLINKEQYQAKIKDLNQIDTDQYKQFLSDILPVLPVEKEIPTAISSMLNQLSSAGLTMTSFSLESGNLVKSGAESFLLKLEVSGSISQIKHLIGLKDQSSRLYQIINYGINNSVTNVSQSNLVVEIFYSPLDTSVKSSPDQKFSALTQEEINLVNRIKLNTQILSVPDTASSSAVKIGKDDPFN